MGYWSDEEHLELEAKMKAEVISAWKEAVSHGSMTDGPRLDVNEMFDDVYEELPNNLIRQREQLAEQLADLKGSSS